MFDDARPGLTLLFSNLGHQINILYICVLFFVFFVILGRKGLLPSMVEPKNPP